MKMKLFTKTTMYAVTILLISFLAGTLVAFVFSLFSRMFGVSEIYQTYGYTSVFLAAFLGMLFWILSYSLARPGSRKWAWFERDTEETGGLFHVLQHRTLLPLSLKAEPDRERVRKSLFICSGRRYSYRNWKKIIEYSILSSVDIHLPTVTLEHTDSPTSRTELFTKSHLLDLLGYHLLDSLVCKKTLEVGEELEISIGRFFSNLQPVVFDHHTGKSVIRVRIESLSSDPKQI